MIEYAARRRNAAPYGRSAEILRPKVVDQAADVSSRDVGCFQLSEHGLDRFGQPTRWRLCESASPRAEELESDASRRSLDFVAAWEQPSAKWAGAYNPRVFGGLAMMRPPLSYLSIAVS